jgi:mannose PTS system EIIC component
MPLIDAHFILILFVTSLLGALVGLDKTAVGQCMFSQPIVAAPLTGWLLGDPMPGIVIGVLLELIWVLDMPVGSFVPADSTISAVSATAIATMGQYGPATLPVIGFSLLLTTSMVSLTMLGDTILRRWTARLDRVAVAGFANNAGYSLAKAHVIGITAFFLKSFILYLIIIPVGIAAVAGFLLLPDPVHRAMTFFVKLLPYLGAALIVRKLSIKHLDLFLLSGFVIAAVPGLVFSVPAPVLIFLTVVGGLLGARYNEQRR